MCRPYLIQPSSCLRCRGILPSAELLHLEEVEGDGCKLALPMLLLPRDALLLEKVINVKSSGGHQSKSLESLPPLVLP